MRRNSITYLSEHNETPETSTCSLCYEDIDKYVVLCECSNEKYCFNCHKDLEINRHDKCPFCRRILQKEVYIDLGKRTKLILKFLFKFTLHIVTTIILPYIAVLTNLTNKKFRGFTKITNDPTFILALTPICSLVIYPVNAIFVSYYIRQPLNMEFFLKMYLFILAYSSLINIIIIVSNSEEAASFVFVLFLLPVFIVPFTLGVIHLLLIYLNYFRERLKYKYFSTLKIIPILVVDRNRRRSIMNVFKRMRRNRVNPSEDTDNEDYVNEQTEYTIEDEELYNSLYSP